MKQRFLIPKRLLLLLMIIITAFSSSAQSVVTGVVTAEDNAPIQGATVIIKNSGKGASTDASGKFSINAKKGDVLVISFVGYGLQEIQVADDLSLSIKLKREDTQLTDVLVTALGIKKETRRIGYAIQDVKAADLTKAREPNAINSLKGNVAGLVVNINPEIGRAPSVNLRGEGRPIFVVDGVPINSDTWNVNPDDIESFTILKGPNAAALYGFAGREGAIIINTKKGNKSKRGFSIDVNSSTMFNNGFIALPKYQDQFGPGEYGKYAFADGKGGGVNDADYDIWGPKFEGQLLPQYDGKYDPTQSYTTTFPDGTTYTGHIEPTTWTNRGKDNLKRFIQTGILTTNSIAVSSSTEKADIRFSLGNTYQKGIVPNTQLSTTNFNSSIGYKFTPRLTFTSDINYTRQSTPNTPDVDYGPNSIIYDIILWGGADWSMDDMRDYWQPGKVGIQQKYAEYFRYNNPWFMSYEWLRGHYQNTVYGYMTLNYKLTDDIDVLVRPSLNTYDWLNTEKFPYSATVYGRPEMKGDYREDRRSLFESNVEAQIKYHKQNIFGFLDIDGFVGGNVRSQRFSAGYTTTNYLNVPGIYAFSNSRDPVIASSFNSEMKVLSAYYSVDLGYKTYVTLNVTGRVDKSSTLPSNNNVFFYPSFNLSTAVSDYVHLPNAISFLKFRGSYTQSKSGGTSDFFYPNTGLDYGYVPPSPYGGPTYSFTPVYNLSTYYNNTVGARYADELIDQNIKTQNRKAYEVGMDVRFLKNRLGFDLTHYRYNNGPLIASQSLSQATGYTSYLLNAGSYTNNGWEATLNGTPVQTKTGFTWNVAVNWSKYVRKWVDNPYPDNYSKDGSRLDLVYADAFVRTPDGQLVHDASSGLLLRYSDLGVSAQKVYGHSDPDWVWGVVNTLSYKNFSLRFQFDGMVGGIIEDYVRKKTLQGGRHIETTEGAFGAARPDDPTGNFSYVGDGVILTGADIQLDPLTGEIINLKDLSEEKNNVKTSVQDYVSRMSSIPDLDIISKTFTKLREVTLTYNIPETVFGKKSFVQRASVSLIGRNLLYFFPSRYKDLDVDQYTSGSGSDLQSPTLRSYGFNINISF